MTAVRNETPALGSIKTTAPSIADIQLSAVIPHANAEGKSERLAQPINCITDVWVCQFRNHNAARHRSIAKHVCNSTNSGETNCTVLSV